MTPPSSCDSTDGWADGEVGETKTESTVVTEAGSPAGREPGVVHPGLAGAESTVKSLCGQ